MGGILLFNYTLLTYIKNYVGPVSMSLGLPRKTGMPAGQGAPAEARDIRGA
jgi:hypothetical protein